MEVWAVGSTKFRQWLGREFYQQYRKAPGVQALTEAENVIAGQALFAGEQRTVHVRIAADGFGGQYIDLGDASWQAVHVTPFGWTVESTPPVLFRRPSGMQPLPIPVHGGSLEELHQFVNLPDEESWALLKAFLVAAMYWEGPYPILALQGQQGSAKSTTARMVRNVVDPSKPELRADPRNLEDLAIASKMNHVMAFDNLSSVQPWLSDALCRLSTGGGFVTRMRYTVEDEAIFDAQRPVIITGIGGYFTRGDVLERSIQITLCPVPEEKRQTEAKLRTAYEAALPGIFGGLLDRLAGALRLKPDVQFERLPRMADFAELAVAAEQAAGETPMFLRAYEGSRDSGYEQAIEASPIGTTLMTVLAANTCEQPWKVTMGQLLKLLDGAFGDAYRKPYGWPTTANALRTEMIRLTPALQGIGLSVMPAKGQRSGGNRSWQLHDPNGVTRTWAVAPGPSTPSTPSQQDVADDPNYGGF
jgi:hypothetical protein